MALTDTSESLQRALLPVAALKLVTIAPQHGYALISALRARGFVKAQGGTLYPLLRSMEADGLVESRWEVDGSGPARKVFHATDRGVQRAAQDGRTVDDAVRSLRTLGEGMST